MQDLKKYHYWYWFAFPAFISQTETLLSPVQTLAEVFSEKQVALQFPVSFYGWSNALFEQDCKIIYVAFISLIIVMFVYK